MTKNSNQRTVKTGYHCWRIAVAVLLLLPAVGKAQDDACLECHGDADLTMERNGREVSIYVQGSRFKQSVHAENECISCHIDADVEEFPHEDDLEPVDCATCHDEAVEKFDRSLHGAALSQGKYLAPTCESCHGKHDILASSNEKAKTYVMNIPSLCGSCHKEGTPVSRLRRVAQRHVLEDYSQSIHGDGLFRRGLIVTAVCTSCHTSHDILPHENSESSINRANIAGTCLQCHAQIERVHRKVIRGALWEKKPHELPICVDCHQPHKVQRVFYEKSFPDSKCLRCHSDENLVRQTNGQEQSLYVNADSLAQSDHGTIQCIKCHTNISQSANPVCLNSGQVDCSMCHAAEVVEYEQSFHSQNAKRGNELAPYCTDCHGVHNILPKDDLKSPTFARNIPDLCGRCHREGEQAAVAYTGAEHGIVAKYTMSIHGKGLLKSGLMVTATCIDCHTAHRELPAADSLSTVHDENIAATCSQCHLGIYEAFNKSIHSPQMTQTDKELPECNDCHLSHTIERVDVDNFRQGILDQCGKCHQDVSETYFETFHGKVSKLGALKTAKCYDCHGAHDILPVSNPASKLSRANIIETCKSCHPNSNRKFVGYLTHATHHNKAKYPYLHGTFWFMSGLLICTFGFFGIHTLLWVPRAAYERRKNTKAEKQKRDAVSAGAAASAGKTYITRFDGFSRTLHVMVILSFISLAITGMTIKFAGVGAFQFLSKIMGGYEVTGFLHRFGAVVTFAYFLLHIGNLIYKKRKERLTLKQMLTGENTIVPRKQDLIEFGQTVKWFLGIGKRPHYGRWTYWEKFDYFAVFWGVAVIGGSGLMLWFPAGFTKLGMPGWFINIATIIHSDEALLATGFIFTVHFFNTHFRPDKFPMDPVIFTGSVSLEELKEDRPREYAHMIETQGIRKRVVAAPPHWLKVGARVFGFSCLALGITVVCMIIYAMFFLYK